MSQPIIWTEGAFLTQQHFQYWESWLLEQQTRVINALVPDAYGLVSCDYDAESLRQQKCIIKSLIWRTHTGQWIIYDNRTMPVLATVLQDVEEQFVYLNFPNNQLCSGLSGYDSGSNVASYKARYQEFSDRYDSSRRQEITLGIPEIRLTTQASDPQMHDSWPLVKIKRLVNTHFEIDNDFIPACLTLAGSMQLQGQINVVIHRMGEKIAALQKMLLRTKDSALNQEYSVISNALFDLKEMLNHGSAQPRECYYLLAKTLNSLSILSNENFQAEAYKHAAMSELIINAANKLNALLSQKVETLQTYMMTKNNKPYHCLENIQADYLQGHVWYLGIDFAHQAKEQIHKFLTQAKLGTVATLEQMIASALPGIPLSHVSRPPNKINLQEGYEYFKLEHESLYWKQVKEERSLMLYLPAFLEGTKIMIDIVKD